MKTHYEKRGHPAKIIDEVYTRAKNKTHKQLMHPVLTEITNTDNNRIPLNLPFNPGSTDIMKLINKVVRERNTHSAPRSVNE